MTKLPAPEQWVLHRMNEMEVAEMIEEYIDFVDGKGKSVRLPSIFVRHFRQRFDDVCPTVVSIATLPIVLADGVLLAPDGLDPDRGIAFKIQPELREVLPRREDCNEAAVREAMKFLTDERLVDVALRRQVCADFRRAFVDRAFAIPRPTGLFRHRRPARRRQDHDDHHADHGGDRDLAGSRRVEHERRGTPQSAAELFSLRRDLHFVGQHRARFADILPPYREKLHRCVLYRPQAWRQ